MQSLLLTTYLDCLPKCKQGPKLKADSAPALWQHPGEEYTILLVITDGVIQACLLPMLKNYFLSSSLAVLLAAVIKNFN